MKINFIVAGMAMLLSCSTRNPKMAESDASVTLTSMTEAPANNSPGTVERKLIRDGKLTFETKNVEQTKKEVKEICQTFQAYATVEEQDTYGGRLQCHITIRIPANHFDAFLEKIESLGRTENKTINTKDVTEEFIDLDTRLKTKKALEERYREILKSAHTVVDILSIEREIATVRSEIESTEGRLQYLKNQVAFSTLDVTYYETIGTDYGFVSKIGQSIKDGWEYLLAFIIGLLRVWPFVIIVSTMGWLIVRLRRNREKKISS